MVLLLVSFFVLLKSSRPLGRIGSITEGMKSNEVLRILGPPTSILSNPAFPGESWEYSHGLGFNYSAVWFSTNGTAELIISQTLFSTRTEVWGEGLPKPTPPAKP